MKKNEIIKAILIVAAMVFTLAITCLFASCNVTRKVTTEAVYHQKGDTTMQIITKTTEIYDASKK